MSYPLYQGAGDSISRLIEGGSCSSIHSADNKLSESVTEKINEFQRPIEEYLDIFVPARLACPKSNSRGAFKIDASTMEDSASFNEKLVDGLASISSAFPPNSRLLFSDNADRVIPLEISGYPVSQSNTGPSIIASLPDRVAMSKSWPQWRDIELVWQVRQNKEDDPVRRWSGEDKHTIVQLFQSARNMLVARHALYVFVVGIYGKTARIFRFDRSAVVVSSSFSYVARPNILREFLWRFLHPIAGGYVSGADPSVSEATREDLQWARRMLPDLPEKHLTSLYWFAIERPGFPKQEYLAIKPLHITMMLFSRATSVWEALLKGDMSGKRFVLKNAWRSLENAPETKIYDHIHDKLSAGESLFGVADMVCGADLGELEVSASRLRLSSVSPPTAVKQSRSASSTRLTIVLPAAQRSRPGMQTRTSRRSPLPPPPAAGHRTISSFGREKANPNRDERTHMRLVFSPVGRPLNKFRSTQEMASAVRDAIKGHRQVYRTGVLHRDISLGNVMIADEEYRGFIGDFDLSVLWEEGTQEPGGVYGTWYYRAIDFLEDPDSITHNFRHDLEGFFWLLVWLVTAYTTHDHHSGDLTAHWLFVGEDPVEAATRKKAWLTAKINDLNVINNEPLTTLLRDFRNLCQLNLDNESQDYFPLSYDAVLDVFEKALAMPGWPLDDAAIPDVNEDSERSESVAPSPKGKRSREDQTPELSRKKARLS